jgi:hypothetical protein
MKEFSNYAEAAAAWGQMRPHFERNGIFLPEAQAFTFADVKQNFALAMDAQPALQTAPNAGIPNWLTNWIDPDVYRILFSPNKGAEILGEVQKGTWVDQTAQFPVVESAGEVSSYGDHNENGRSTTNINWVPRQSYLFQGISEYGELEVARAGLGRINWVSEVDASVIITLNKFQNTSYFFGLNGLQNFGLLNDPNLSAALTPAPKAYGGVKWVNNGQIVATANEIFADIQALFYQLIQVQTGGLLDQNSEMTLALSPGSELAMTATNSFGVNVSDLLKKNFPKISIVSAVQYSATPNTSNPGGIPAGNLVQLIAKQVEGQKVGYCAYNERLRAHPIVRMLSAWKKKQTSGTWGAIIRQPMLIAQMVGI